MIAELLHDCLSVPQSRQLEQSLIWLALLHGLEELGPALAAVRAPLVLTPQQIVALYAAMHIAGKPAQAGVNMQRILTGVMAQADEAAGESPWQLTNNLQEWTESSPWAKLIHYTSMLHLGEPAVLFDDWLTHLDTSLATRMPFAALLQLSILVRSPKKLPKNWQVRLAEAINAVGDLADSIPLYRFWMVVCQIAPAWDFACIRAADIALQYEDFAISEELLNRMNPINISNPWFFDVHARCRYAYGDLRAAASMWSVALLKMDANEQDHQVMRDRLLVALRGKFGVGEAIRLARCGETAAAIKLLSEIILHDPFYANHYKLLASLQTCDKQGESASNVSTVDMQSIEHVIERFSSLWQEDPPAKSSVKDPAVQPLEYLQYTAEFLDRIEGLIGLS